MNELDGVWRLVESRAWTEQNQPLESPYGLNPMGHITFSNGRMLAALCNGDAAVKTDRSYSSYGGTYTFDGSTLEVLVDMASDTSRLGHKQIRTVVSVTPDQILLRPPTRQYGAGRQRRELLWERVWNPDSNAAEHACGSQR